MTTAVALRPPEEDLSPSDKCISIQSRGIQILRELLEELADRERGSQLVIRTTHLRGSRGDSLGNRIVLGSTLKRLAEFGLVRPITNGRPTAYQVTSKLLTMLFNFRYAELRERRTLSPLEDLYVRTLWAETAMEVATK